MATTISAGDWLQSARSALKGTENSSLEARLILAHVLEKPAAFILAHPELPVNLHFREIADQMVARLIKGEPLPYLLGTREFYELNFIVRPGVLIPRPETELIVEKALTWLRNHPERKQVLDVGTGTGCIAAALAMNDRSINIVAVDISRTAVETARENFQNLRLESRIQLVQADLVSALSGRFDLITANLPYIPSATLEQLAVRQYEPELALNGGKDGVSIIERLVNDLQRVTADGGFVLIEIESGHSEIVLNLINTLLPQSKVSLHNDLAGLPRLIAIEYLKR